VSHAQLKVMHAILACRTAALGGFVARCENPECAYTVSRTAVVAIVPARSARAVKPLPGWGSARPSCCRFRISILFTLPAEIGAIAYQNKAEIYGLLFKAASETMLTIAHDPKHLGAKTGITAVLHTWGSAMTHHPHVHMIVTGGGISPDGSRCIASRPDYLVPVEVLSSLPGPHAGDADRCSCRRPPQVLRQVPASCRHAVLQGLSRPSVDDGLVCLRQAPVRRTAERRPGATALAGDATQRFVAENEIALAAILERTLADYKQARLTLHASAANSRVSPCAVSAMPRNTDD